MREIDGQFYMDVLRRLARIYRPSKPAVHPSSFSCYRRVTFELMGKEGRQEMTPELRELMDTGTALHRMIQGHYKAGIPLLYEGAKFEDEVKLNPDNCERAKPLLIRCSVDGIFRFPQFAPRVFEIKSVGASEMNSLRAPRTKDLEQVNTYMYLLEAPAATLHYVSRANVQNRQIYPYHFNKELWEKTRENIEMAIQAAFAHRLPPTDATDYTCGICPFFYCCPRKEEWHDA